MKYLSPKDHLEEIKAMLPYKSYQEIADIIGCGHAAVSYWAKKLGLRENRYHGRFKNAIEIVKENWGTHTSTEIAEMVGCKPSNIVRIKTQLGLKRTEEQERAIKKRGHERIGAAHRAIAERDRRRMKYGMEPLSRLFDTLAPRHILQVGYNLHAKHGYEYTEDPYVLSRNGHKLTSEKWGEEYYTKRYKIRFID